MNNTYGTVRPALMDINNDVDIFYQYRPTRNTVNEAFSNFIQVIPPSDMLSYATVNTSEDDNRLPGMFNLKLPVGTFGNVGFYTIYIRPKEYRATIMDVGNLESYPDIKGIVIQLDSSNVDWLEGGMINGYRVEYLDGSGELVRQEMYRIVTGCYKCVSVGGSVYRLDTSGNIYFLTLTPSTAPSYAMSASPYIGANGQQVVISNTKFDPIMVEVEITKHDIETLNTAIDGNQIRSLDSGLLTTFNENGEIYSQKEFATIKSTYTSTELYEIKKDMGNQIDSTVLGEYSEIMGEN